MQFLFNVVKKIILFISYYRFAASSNTSKPSVFSSPPMLTLPSNIDDGIIHSGKIEEATTSALNSKRKYQINSRPFQLTKAQENVKVSKLRLDSDDEKETNKPNNKKRRKKSPTNIKQDKLMKVFTKMKQYRNCCLFGYSEETDYLKLNENRYLHEAKCFKCKKMIVHKIASSEENGNNETFFNNKSPECAFEHSKIQKNVVCSY